MIGLSLFTCTSVKKASMGARKAGHGGHGGGEIFGFQRRGDRGFGLVQGGEQGTLGVGFGEFRISAIGVLDTVLVLGLGQDVAGAAEPRQQVGPVFGFQHRRQRFGALDQQRQVIIAGHGKAGVDDIVSDALITEEDFEAVVEEGEEV
jgi:hypothetical protein